VTWEKFYLICFLVGFVLSLLSFVMGSFHLHIHLPGHAHMPHFSGAHGAGHAGGGHGAAGHAVASAHASAGAKIVAGKAMAGRAAAGKAVSGKAGVQVHWFNYFTLLAFVAWFGAAGFLLVRHGFAAASSLSLSVCSGLIGGSIVFFFFAKVLMPYDRPLNDADFEMIGLIARVSSPIREKGVGEIMFVQADTRRCCGACSETGEAISKDAEVVVVRYDKGIAWVKEWEKFMNDEGSSETSVLA